MESKEVTSTSEGQREGRKDDLDKIRFDLIPEDALWEIARVYTIGAKKYDPWNWQSGIKYSRIVAALRRHLAKFIMGEDLDEQDGQHHLASVAWAANTLLHYELNKERYEKFDDRRKGMWSQVWKEKK
ncbi:MAG: hypothetical protein KGI27_10005 [Thaumarchaeota archaeon]|nr:hypothetical protein [Nitrososphaerota archaeon]